MTMTINERFRRGALNGALAELNVGSADAGGDCRLLDAGAAELAALGFSNPAFAAATTPAANVAEAQSNTISQDSTITPNTVIARVQWRDRDNVVIVDGTVGVAGSGADLIVSSATIPADASAVTSPGLSAALVMI